MKIMEDRVLLKGILHGSVPAFRKLTAEYIPLVSRTSYRIMCDRSDSEYVTKEVFASLWHDPLSYMEADSMSDALLKRTCIICRRRLARRRLYGVFSIHPDLFVMSSPSVPSADEYIARQAWEVFCRASRNCSDRQRILYTLHELEGLPVSTSARVGRYLEFTAEEALNAARRRVKEELDAYGRMDDYISYVGFLRKVEDQLTDKTRLLSNIMQELFA